MLIALLAVLGVDLVVVVLFLAAVLPRRRWVSRQPGAFKGAIRVDDGQVPGFAAKWRCGYGRWVRDVLVWEKAPFLFRGTIILVDAPAGQPRAAASDEVRRLGKHVVVAPMAVEGGARIDLATAAGDRGKAHGPFPVAGKERSAS